MINNTIETQLRTDVFEKFVIRYREKYGEMKPEIASMFFEKFLHIETREFEAVAKLMFQNRRAPFKWLDVLERHDVLYPSNETRKHLDDAWRLEADKNQGKDKKRIHAIILKDIPRMVENNPTGWRVDYFKKLLDLLGEEECVTMATNITGQFPEFKEWLYGRKQKI